MKINFHPIIDISDPILLEWLELYETAFPADERILISEVIRSLASQVKNGGGFQPIQACLDENGNFIALIWVEIQKQLAILWYLAVKPEQRSRGIGSCVYQILVESLCSSGCKALVFEVEIPSTNDPDEQANRRIEFYRHNGAFLLEGIDYLQYVGSHQPPKPMHLMVHLFEPMDALQAYAQAKEVFQDALRQNGPLRLI